MSKFEKLITLLKVVEENSIIGAAKKLNISNAAVSKQLTLLEQQLNTQLIQRNKRQITLTEIGQRYVEAIKRVMNEMERADALITSAKEIPHGELYVTSNLPFFESYILPKLEIFLARYPYITLHFDLNERFPDFSREKIDILCGVNMWQADELIAKKILSTRYVLCASPNYIERFGLPNTPYDLVHHRYITHTKRSPNQVVKFKELEILLTPYMYFNDTYAMLQAALSGIGIVRLHDYRVKAALEKGQLIEILHFYQEPSLPLFLFYRYNRFVDNKLRVFINYLVENTQEND